MRDLEEYLKLIDQERERRPSEAMLADEILRLRPLIEQLKGALLHAHEAEGVCYCLLHADHCLVRLNDGEA